MGTGARGLERRAVGGPLRAFTSPSTAADALSVRGWAVTAIISGQFGFEDRVVNFPGGYHETGAFVSRRDLVTTASAAVLAARLTQAPRCSRCSRAERSGAPARGEVVVEYTTAVTSVRARMSSPDCR